MDAKYYYDFEPDAFLSKLFNGTLFVHNSYYEDGNSTTNSRGGCLVVNRKAGRSDTAAIPDACVCNTRCFAEGDGLDEEENEGHFLGL